MRFGEDQFINSVILLSFLSESRIIAENAEDAELRDALLPTRLWRKEMSETQKHFPRLLCPPCPLRFRQPDNEPHRRKT